MESNSWHSNVIILSIVVLLIVSMIGCTVDNDISIPLAEHPRPDFMRNAWINLNGQWDFALDPDEIGELNGWYNDGSVFDQRITVPFSWAAPLSGIVERNIHIGWYARNLEIPVIEEWINKRIYIVIGASDFGTRLWLNGDFVGEHEGGYTPFEFDLTDVIDKTGSNRLVIRVEDKPVRGRQNGKQAEGFGPVKGKWQTVYLEAHSDTYIRLAQFSPDIDNEKVNLKIELSKATESDMRLSVFFKAKSNETHEDGYYYYSLEPVQKKIPAGHNNINVDIPIYGQHLWTLDDPFLYDVELSLSRKGEEYDRINTYFGMRKIGTERLPDSNDMYITLNNKPIYLQMALDQAYHPEGYYTYPSDAFMREDIQRAKNIGLNGLRIHLKAGISRQLYWADKLGLLIQADISNLNTSSNQGVVSEYGRKNWEYTFQKQIERDFNHPSIFSWVLFNETWGISSNDPSVDEGYPLENREWVKSLYFRAKNLDPTRLVEDNSPNGRNHIISDINSWHNYLPGLQYAAYLDDAVANTYPGSEWNYIGGNKQTDIPLMNSESSAKHAHKDHPTGDFDLSHEYHIMVNTFRKYQKNAGFVFTEFHDVNNNLVIPGSLQNTWNGYYRYDRTKKDWGLDELCPGMTINDFHSAMYLIPGSDFNRIVQPGVSFTLPITASFMTDNVPSEMKVQTVVHGWNRYGEHNEYSSDEFTFQPEPYKVFDLNPVSVQAPNEECLAVLYTYLIDEQEQIRHRNFVPFRVQTIEPEQNKSQDSQQVVLRLEPADYSESEWSIKQVSVLDGLKMWGTGTGYFEYEFPLPEDFEADTIGEVEFLAELGARYVHGKYMKDEYADEGSKFYREDYNPRSDPGYRTNTYSMTDEKNIQVRFILPSMVRISTQYSWKTILPTIGGCCHG